MKLPQNLVRFLDTLGIADDHPYRFIYEEPDF